MSNSYCLFDVCSWDDAGLSRPEDFLHLVDYTNSEEWVYIPEQSLENGNMVIYYGVCGNIGELGEPVYTHAEVYNPTCPQDMMAYLQSKRRLKSPCLLPTY